MLVQAAEELSLDLSSSWMIGDELADIQAGHAAGTRTVLLRPDADRLSPVAAESLEGVVHEEPDKDRPAAPDFYAVNLIDAARLIAQQPKVEQAESLKQSVKQTGKRRWDAEKIAKIQVPRPSEEQPVRPASAKTATREFRPWDVPSRDDDRPLVSKPIRRRATEPQGKTPTPRRSGGTEPAVSDTQPEPADQPSETAPPGEIPSTIRKAIERKQDQAIHADPDQSPEREKLLRMILKELRAQRGVNQEFSFLTIIAVALQLVGVVCLLGGFFMGSGDDGLFLRWFGAAVTAQLMSIATLMYGR